MKHWRLSIKMGLLIGVLVLTSMMIAGVGIYGLDSVNKQLVRVVGDTLEKLRLSTEIRTRLLEQIRAGKNAILSEDDEQSRRYKKRAEAERETIDKTLADLELLLEADGEDQQRKYLAEFKASWDELKEQDREMLELAIQNSNLKATDLHQNESYETLKGFQEALSGVRRHVESTQPRPIEATQTTSGAKTPDRFEELAEAQVNILRWHGLQAFHIDALTSRSMDELEGRMKLLQDRIEEELRIVSETFPEAKDESAKAREALTSFEETNSRIITHSRANSNELSAQMSMGPQEVLQKQAGEKIQDLTRSLRAELGKEKEYSDSTYRQATYAIVGFSVVGIAIGLFLSLAIKQAITGPVAACVSMIQTIAEGDLSRRLNLDQEDEIGELAHAMDSVVCSLTRIVADIRSVSGEVNRSANELSTVSTNLLSRGQDVSDQSVAVAGATEEMSANINTMAASAEQMSMNVVSISSATEQMSVNIATISSTAEQTSTNVGTVARSIEEMTKAFQEIENDVKEGSRVANEASSLAQDATASMNSLDSAASEINKVTEVIKTIALQTNLLALNATIEATAAGEAGKGFAVVAGEIKELANQSAQAAEDIASKIEGAQSSTREAVAVIKQVAEIIGAINQSTNRVAESVERQTRSANVISQNVRDADSGVENIAVSIAEVAKGANDTSKNAGEAAKGASDMSRNTGEAARTAVEISRNIHSVSESSRENVESSRKVSASSAELSRIAAELQRLVERFKLEG
ncbi:Methyl-accepting chemotaxis protein 4 [Planctomycetes bacterium Pan216]|uniref:Methyl-accepting chemotaxis protein 4 n=1 Tax=Kolteria novifilia TaxID=2527975 RepID=A0A518B2I7_9BACT|nr:Methyl-accepting chemotaxis protein 4 [Planctomycetes bacterium Pan216]